MGARNAELHCSAKKRIITLFAAGKPRFRGFRPQLRRRGPGAPPRAIKLRCVDRGRGLHEDRYPPEVRRHPGHLQLRQHVHDALDRREAAARRSLLRLPPVLHWQAEGVDTAGRIDKFRQRYAAKPAAKPAAPSPVAKAPPPRRRPRKLPRRRPDDFAGEKRDNARASPAPAPVAEKAASAAFFFESAERPRDRVVPTHSMALLAPSPPSSPTTTRH